MKTFPRNSFLLLTLFLGGLSFRLLGQGAQFMQLTDKLTGTGAVPGTATTGEGYAVALSKDGSTAIVGSPGDNGGIGAAWIYTRSGGAWNQQGVKLVGFGRLGNSNQGYSVALSADGSLAAVGAPGDNSSAGAVWIFTRFAGIWAPGKKLVTAGGTGQQSFGASVAVSGNGSTLVAGGPDDNGTVGAAWVFVRTAGTWSQQGSKLTASDAVGTPHEGASVDISNDGNSIIVGGYTDHSIGAAWIYTRTSGAWSQQGSKLVGSGGVGGAGFQEQGRSVSISGDGGTAIIGGPMDGGLVGAAWVFALAGGVWSQQGNKLVASDHAGPSFQGWSVCLSGDGNTAIVGGQGDGLGVGAAWVFARSAGVWSQQGTKLVGSDSTGASLQGSDVSLTGTGDVAMVGGPGDLGGTGAAWIFAVPDLIITSFHNGSFVQGQTNATFTVLVANMGGYSTVNTVTVTDTVPAGLTLVSLTGAAWDCRGNSCNRSDGLSPGGFYQPITVTVSVAANAPASVTNVATVSGGGENNTANDTTSDVTPIGGPVSTPAFFAGQTAAGNGVYSLQFSNNVFFGYYAYLSNQVLYHFDLGYESYISANDTQAGVFLFDFKSGHWFYTNPSKLPQFYDYTLKAWLYYFPASNNPGHYTSNPRVFLNLSTGQVLTM